MGTQLFAMKQFRAKEDFDRELSIAKEMLRIVDNKSLVWQHCVELGSEQHEQELCLLYTPVGKRVVPGSMRLFDQHVEDLFNVVLTLADQSIFLRCVGNLCRGCLRSDTFLGTFGLQTFSSPRRTRS